LMGQSFQARSCQLIWAWNLGTSSRSGAEALLHVWKTWEECLLFFCPARANRN
jgi:hypothetical protein